MADKVQEFRKRIRQNIGLTKEQRGALLQMIKWGADIDYLLSLNHNELIKWANAVIRSTWQMQEHTAKLREEEELRHGG